MPGKPREPTGWGEFTPLQESAFAPPAADEETPAPVVVTLIKAGANGNKTTFYTPEFLRQTLAEGHFSGALMRLDHPTPTERIEKPEGSLSAIAARTGDAFWDEQEQAIKAPLVWVADGVPGSPAQRMKAIFSDPVLAQKAGLSIAWHGGVEYGDAIRTQDGHRLRRPVKLAPRPGDQMFIDFVTSPAAGGRVPLLASNRPEEDTAMEAIADLTLDELTAQRPDLIEAIRAASAPPPAPEAAPPVDIGAELREALAPVTARLDAIENRAATAEGTQRVNDLIATAGLQEAAANIVRADLSGRTYESDEQLQEAYKASVDRINALMESTGAPKVTGLGAPPPAEDTPATSAADALRAAGLLPRKDGD